MQIHLQIFWSPKAGNSLDEYEDAFDFSYNRWRRTNKPYPFVISVSREIKQPRFAVGDGATESSFSGLWARMLTEMYVCRKPNQPSQLRKWVKQLGDAWLSHRGAKSLPWYAEEKSRRGAFSTLLGLSLEKHHGEKSSGCWHAVAVGDSCLFQIRESQILTAFPMSDSEQLGYHPTLLSSVFARNETIWDTDPFRKGEWSCGDTFLLMTDAIAHWFLTSVENGGNPWTTVDEVASQTSLISYAFQQWVNSLREKRQMRNDDVTLLLVKIHDG